MTRRLAKLTNTSRDKSQRALCWNGDGIGEMLCRLLCSPGEGRFILEPLLELSLELDNPNVRLQLELLPDQFSIDACMLDRAGGIPRARQGSHEEERRVGLEWVEPRATSQQLRRFVEGPLALPVRRGLLEQRTEFAGIGQTALFDPPLKLRRAVHGEPIEKRSPERGNRGCYVASFLGFLVREGIGVDELCVESELSCSNQRFVTTENAAEGIERLRQSVTRPGRVALGPQEMKQAVSTDPTSTVSSEDRQNSRQPAGQFGPSTRLGDLQAETSKYSNTNHLHHLISA
jgi:hypothetical protein